MAILIIIAISLVCGIGGGLFVLLLSHGSRDNAARDRDYGLARLFESRASLLHIEELERRSALNAKNEEIAQRREEAARIRRDTACDNAREPEHG